MGGGGGVVGRVGNVVELFNVVRGGGYKVRVVVFVGFFWIWEIGFLGEC